MTTTPEKSAILDLSVENLHEWDQNPRKISKEALKRLENSLEREPEMLRARPLIALPDGTVIAGNMRLRAARDLGLETLPVYTVDLDRNRAREWALRDNAFYGDWQEGALAQMLQEMEAEGADLDLTGFDDRRLNELLDDLGALVPADEDAVPALPEDPDSAPGGVYELGPHRLVCGDSTDPAVLALLMDGHLADCVWTDPPYGVDIQERDLVQAEIRGRRKDGLGVANDDLGPDALRELLSDALGATLMVCEKGAPWYVSSPAGELSGLFGSVLGEIGVWRHTLIWVKDQFVMGRADYHYRHEPIFYGWAPGAAHPWIGDRKQDSVLEIPRPRRSESHPTMKPVELVKRCIGNSTKRGALVLDPFAGSGSTLIAADRLGRRARLVELDPRYCDVIRQRYEETSG